MRWTMLLRVSEALPLADTRRLISSSVQRNDSSCCATSLVLNGPPTTKDSSTEQERCPTPCDRAAIGGCWVFVPDQRAKHRDLASGDSQINRQKCPTSRRSTHN